MIVKIECQNNWDVNFSKFEWLKRTNIINDIKFHIIIYSR